MLRKRVYYDKLNKQIKVQLMCKIDYEFICVLLLACVKPLKQNERL